MAMTRLERIDMIESTAIVGDDDTSWMNETVLFLLNQIGKQARLIKAQDRLQNRLSYYPSAWRLFNCDDFIKEVEKAREELE